MTLSEKKGLTSHKIQGFRVNWTIFPLYNEFYKGYDITSNFF